MTDPLSGVSTKQTPQTERAEPNQVQNNAGGFVFGADDMTRLRRFLTLGTTGGTYYVDERRTTMDNAQLVLDMARNRTADVVNEVVAISTAGRAPRQNPALFALAAAAKLGDKAGRRLALEALPAVARTGTHLFLFAGYVEQFGGWGRGTRAAVAHWYLDRPVAQAAYQAVKYRQREGWTHRDLLRLAHPRTWHWGPWYEAESEGKPDTKVRTRDQIPTHPHHARLFDWICGHESNILGLDIVDAFQRVQNAETVQQVTDIIGEGDGLSWEMIPDQFLNEVKVWEALLEKGIPQTALMRQLPRLTNLGLLSPLGNWASHVAAQLSSGERLKKGRVHPINVLVAARTYAQGHGMRGSLTWDPSRPIVDALDQAFYNAFGAVEPSNKRLMLALDVSGSMAWSNISGLPLTPREASAALALVTAATEPTYEITAFSHTLVPVSISPRQRLNDVINTVSQIRMGGTDCAQPMLYAMRENLAVDTFVIYTDNETWAGDTHPYQALQAYRQKTGIPAQLIVVGMTATECSIADPNDAGMLDVAGFDSAIPNLVSDFARGAMSPVAQ